MTMYLAVCDDIGIRFKQNEDIVFNIAGTLYFDMASMISTNDYYLHNN